ncbi:MAG: ABC transporter ATP-binding protein [Spirochaetes bacterium]|nr:ABC transporter ATP-binding protein [Spirochaetota bacterium]
MMLSVKNLSFKYKRNKVLNNISFEVDKKEIVSILGPNGAGKSTLIKCINRILNYKEGTIQVDNENIRLLSQNKIAKNIGYVPQRAESCKLTVFDAILLGRKPHIKFKAGDKDLKIVYSVMKNLNLEKLSLRYVEELSGGEMQKVSIARALVQDPKIILMDEPTNNLDLKNQQEILNLISDIAIDHELAIIISVHDINTALRYSNKIIFLKNGRIYKQITPDEVSSKIIEDVYEVKVNIHEFKDYHHIIPV